MLGLALVGVALSIAIVLGVPYSFGTLVLSLVASGVAGVAPWLALVLEATWPGGGSWRSFGADHRLPRGAFAGSLAGFGLGRLGILRAERDVAVSRADRAFFRELVDRLAARSSLEASGSTSWSAHRDLHVQFWFFACGYVADSRRYLPRVPRPALALLLLVLVRRVSWADARPSRLTSSSTTSSRWRRSSSLPCGSSPRPWLLARHGLHGLRAPRVIGHAPRACPRADRARQQVTFPGPAWLSLGCRVAGAVPWGSGSPHATYRLRFRAALGRSSITDTRLAASKRVTSTIRPRPAVPAVGGRRPAYVAARSACWAVRADAVSARPGTCSWCSGHSPAQPAVRVQDRRQHPSPAVPTQLVVDPQPCFHACSTRPGAARDASSTGVYAAPAPGLLAV